MSYPLNDGATPILFLRKIFMLEPSDLLSVILNLLWLNLKLNSSVSSVAPVTPSGLVNVIIVVTGTL